jgi:hypothetical protein
VGETVVTFGGFAVRGVWMGSDGEPSELSEETEAERYRWWWPPAVLIGMGLEWGTLSVLSLAIASEMERSEREEATACPQMINSRGVLDSNSA